MLRPIRSKSTSGSWECDHVFLLAKLFLRGPEPKDVVFVKASSSCRHLMISAWTATATCARSARGRLPISTNENGEPPYQKKIPYDAPRSHSTSRDECKDHITAVSIRCSGWPHSRPSPSHDNHTLTVQSNSRLQQERPKKMLLKALNVNRRYWSGFLGPPLGDTCGKHWRYVHSSGTIKRDALSYRQRNITASRS
jgi:hypothetical protein